MSLPIVTLPIDEHWDCAQCSVCCRGSTIRVSASEAERIQSLKWPERVDLNLRRVLVGEPENARLAQRADGSCVFLLANGLCAIHQEFGADAKPLTCRMFPLQLILQEKQAVLTLRRACPTAAADRGRDIVDHLPAARALAAAGDLAAVGGIAPPFKAGESADWKRTRPVLEALRRITVNERFAPIHRLVQGIEFCRLLEAANTEQFDNRKFLELIQVVEENVADEAAIYFGERVSPGSAARVLFRQIALDAIRIHPGYRVVPRWTTRLHMAWWAWRMLRGQGELPQVHNEFPKGTFAQLEQPLGRLDIDIYRPLFRYMQTTTTTFQYALANKHGWSVIESYRQLAVFYALALWVLRWATLGRVPRVADMEAIVCMLDRAQGQSRLAGAGQRARLARLASLQALPGLLSWYGR